MYFLSFMLTICARTGRYCELMQDLYSENRLSKVPSALHAGEAIHTVRAATSFDNWLRRGAGDDNNNDRLQNVQRMQSAAAHYKNN